MMQHINCIRIWTWAHLHSSNMMFDVVASPHMANLLLSDEEDLLSKKNRFIKKSIMADHLKSMLRTWMMRMRGMSYES